MTSPAELVRETLVHRARRARLLAGQHQESAQVLTFYAHLAEAQAALLDHADDVVPAPISESGLAADLSRPALEVAAARFLAAVRRHAPPPLASSLGARAVAGSSAWGDALDAAMAPEGSHPSPTDPANAFLCEVLVQPFAELAARYWAGSPAAGRPRVRSDAGAQRCPYCGDRPVVGILREQGHGAGRLLVCGRCATEWPAPRMVCPSCATIDVQALPVFRADDWPAVRIESCERCRRYLKSLDLTVDGAAVPLVDDLASLPLDLWALEQGLARARANVLKL